jgi:hypothetical protein
VRRAKKYRNRRTITPYSTTWFLLNNNSNKPPSSRLHAGSHAGLCACIASSLLPGRDDDETPERGSAAERHLTFGALYRELISPLMYTWSRTFSPLYHQSLISNRTSSVLCFTRHGIHPQYLPPIPPNTPQKTSHLYWKRGPTDHTKSQVVLTLF